MAAEWLLALSLAVDAAAAAMCCALSVPGYTRRDGIKVGLWFGAFQAAMSLLGGLGGGEAYEHFRRVGAVAAFGLLLFLGLRMAAEAARPTESCPGIRNLHAGTLAALALATSMDALAAGVGLVYLDAPLALSAGIIGAVAFALSWSAGRMAGRAGPRLGRWASALGGAALIAVGFHILLGG